MEETHMREYRLLPIIAGIFVGVLILSNILASKMIQLGPLMFDGGTLLFPISYIFGDVLTEVYGYKASRKVIWTGFIMLILSSLNIWIIAALPAQADWQFQRDFEHILLQMPRLSAASIVGYFMGEYVNSVVLSRLKVMTGGRRLWVRTISSTLAGEFIDTALFVCIAFGGLYTMGTLIQIIFSGYLFKCLIEILFTPLTYAAVSFTKRSEGLDVYDIGETYNPLPGR